MRIHLRISLDVCYGLLALFQTILHNVFLLYHVDMFVSVYKIDKVSFWVGETIFLIWNSVNDPLFGWLSDKYYLISKEPTSQSYNDVVQKRLSTISFCGPLYAISFFLFWLPWGNAPYQFVVCLCLYDGFLTMVDLNHSALLADLAVSAQIRTKLNSRSSLFSALGSASVFISYAAWNKDSMHGFRIFCAVLSVLSFVGFFSVAQIMKNKILNSPGKFNHDDRFKLNRELEHDQLEKPSYISFLKQLWTQKNFFYFSVMNLTQVFHCHFNSNFFPLFLERILGASVAPGFGSFLLGVSFLAPHINNLYFLSLCQRYGVYFVVRLLFIIKLTISLVMFCVGPDSIWMLCLFIASNRVFTEGTCKLLNLVISDLVDEDFVLHHRKKAVSALVYGTAALLSKPGQTLAPLIGTFCLSMQMGFDIFESELKNKIDQNSHEIALPETPSNQRIGCFNLLVYVPIICALIQLTVWTKFTLRDRRLDWIKSARLGIEHAVV